jgi:hypothetical protein
MNRITKFTCALAVASTMVGPVASADEPQQQDQMPQREKMPQRDSDMNADKPMLTKMVNITATVDKVDQDKRMLSLKMDDGSMMMVHVPDGVKRFSEIKDGDKVKLDFYESLALAWKRSGLGVTGEATMIGKGKGKLPSGMMASVTKESVEITKVDKAANQITVKMPDGKSQVLDVKDPALKADLSKAKEGDHLELTFTQAEALAVEKAK